MDSYIHEFLLFVSLVAAPIIFGFLLYLGLTIVDHEPAESLPKIRKPPRR